MQLFILGKLSQDLQDQNVYDFWERYGSLFSVLQGK